MRIRVLLLGLSLALAGSACGTTKPGSQRAFRIGAFHVGLDHIPPSFPAMKDALASLGYVDGKNIIVEWHNLADETAARAQAAAFVKEKVDVIVAFENQTARASKASTSVIPVVFLHVTNPIAEKFVQSLAAPGGNMTGTVGLRDLPAKQLEMLKKVDPTVRRVIALIDPKDPTTATLIAKARAAAAPLGFTLLERNASTQADVEGVFAAVKAGSADASLLVSPTLQTKFQSLTIALSAAHHLAFESVLVDWAKKGALLSYGPDYPLIGRKAAEYVVKIIHGTRPADLPVLEVPQLLLAINLKTASALGVAVPQSALDLADAVFR